MDPCDSRTTNFTNVWAFHQIHFDLTLKYLINFSLRYCLGVQLISVISQYPLAEMYLSI